MLESATIRRFGLDATIPFFPKDMLFIASKSETHIKINLQSSAISLGLFDAIAPMFAKGCLSHVAIVNGDLMTSTK